MDKQEACVRMLDCIENGQAILQAGNGIPNLKHTIHDVPKARHLGFGYFEGDVEGIKVQFDAGGAMRRVDHEGEWIVSWSPLIVDDPKAFEILGIDLDEQRRIIVEWMNEDIK
jgi:hypothetical protein